MPLIHEPFYRLRTDDERAKDISKVFPMRLNQREQAMAKRLMVLFNVKSPVTALKFAAEVGLNVIHSTFGDDLMRRLFAKERIKLEDYEDPDKPENIKL